MRVRSGRSVLPHNSNYKNDTYYTLQLCQWLLKPLGMWPRVYYHCSTLEHILSIPLMAVSLFILCFVFLPASYYIMFKEEDIHIRVKFFGPLWFSMTSTIKFCYFGVQGRTFGHCIDLLEKDWRVLSNPEHRDIMLRNVSTGRNLVIVCAIFLYTGNMFYNGVLPVLSKTVVENTTIRVLAYPGYQMFVDSQASPAYEILLGMHCLYSIVTANITTACFGLVVAFVTHACGQLEIQMARLESLVEDYKDMQKGEHSEDLMGIIVGDHVQAIRFSRTVDEVLRLICLLEIFTSSLTICMLEYYCLKETNDTLSTITFVMLLFSVTLNMFTFCYVGELLIIQGDKIGAVSYGIDWYELPDKEALGLVLIMAISKYPPKLTVGKLFDLSLATFSSVLKTSVAYLNLLRAVTEW